MAGLTHPSWMRACSLHDRDLPAWLLCVATGHERILCVRDVSTAFLVSVGAVDSHAFTLAEGAPKAPSFGSATVGVAGSGAGPQATRLVLMVVRRSLR